MRPCPAIVGGARVICYTPIDARHRRTSNTTHLVGGEETDPAQGLAICQYDGEEAFYLFACDAQWNAQTDTWHESLQGAKEQAEFEYAGAYATWISAH